MGVGCFPDFVQPSDFQAYLEYRYVAPPPQVQLFKGTYVGFYVASGLAGAGLLVMAVRFVQGRKKTAARQAYLEELMQEEDEAEAALTYPVIKQVDP